MHITMTNTDVWMYALTFMTGLAIGLGNGNLFVGWDRILFAAPKQPAAEEDDEGEEEGDAEEGDAEEDAEEVGSEEEAEEEDAEEVVSAESPQVRRRWLWVI